MPAKGADPASRHPDVAEEELEHGHGPDELHAEGVVRPSEGVKVDHGFVRRSGFGNKRRHFEEILLLDAGDILDEFRCVSAVMRLEQIEGAAGMGERHVHLRHSLVVFFIIPEGLIVCPLFGAVA